MTQRLSGTLTLVIAIAFGAAMLGCDSSSDDGAALSAETSEAVAKTFSDAFGVISLAIAEVQVSKAQTDPKTTDPQGGCPNGGSFEASGSGESTQDSFSLSVSVELNDCNGLNGALSIDGIGSFSSSSIFVDLLVDGSIAGEQCSLSFERFRETVSSDLTAETTTLTLDGVYRGTCSQDQFTCSFDDVSVNASSAGGADIVAQSCRLD